MTFSAADMELITPGAVFLKENGNQRFALFMTKAVKGYKQRVVFANSKGVVFAMPVAEFLNTSKFHNVEPNLEHRLNNLFSFTGDETEETLDSVVAALTSSGTSDAEIVDFNDGDTQPIPDIIEATVTDVPTDVAPELPEVSNPVTFIATAGAPNPPVASEVLAAMLVSYAQEPNLSMGMLLHKLTFAVPVNITTDQIRSCFNLGSDTSTGYYYMFELAADHFGNEAGKVDWTFGIGGYPIFQAGQSLFQIVLGEEVNVNASQETQAAPEGLAAASVG